MNKPVVVNHSDFGEGWEATPLTPPPGNPLMAPNTKPSSAASAIQPEADEALKPMIPFIASIEKKLIIRPPAGEGPSARLNRIQTVMFGEITYRDAGPLLAKLAELFPEQAQEAQATLQAQLQQQMLAPAPAKASAAVSPVAMNVSPKFQPPAAPMPQPPQASGLTTTRQFANDRWDQDPFYEDEPRESHGGSNLKAIGQSLLSLAMIAGSLAGGYYLNKKMGAGDTSVAQPMVGGYPAPYYQSPYYPGGYAQPYGMRPYGYPTNTYPVAPGYYGPAQIYQYPGSYGVRQPYWGRTGSSLLSVRPF